MAVLFGVIFLHLDQLLADCKMPIIAPFLLVTNFPFISFAFVEYEDRRDADDAYHEMHNKRMGRDDLLKIEVRFSN
jgi:hypothetical protein